MAFPCIRGHHIYDSILGPESIILDLGGHKGEFSTILIEHYGCTSHCVEAMPDLFQALPKLPRLHAYHYAASDADGTMTFHIASNPESNSLKLKSEEHHTSIEVPTISIPTLLSTHGISRIDLLKMDIEGAEIDVIKGMSDSLLTNIQQITVEFHDFIPEMNVEQEVLQTISRLKSLDFACIVFSRKTHFDVLFLNKQFISSQTIFHARIIKYIHGLGRMIKRVFS